MTIKKHLSLAAGLAFAAALASASNISYTCAPNIDATVAGTCNALNTTIAGLYNSTFSNANASIFIQYGATDLGESTGANNFVSYGTYLSALTADSSGDAVDLAALASLPSTEPALYNGGDVEITSALGAALGLPGLSGVTSDGVVCDTPGVGSCYDAVITLTTDPSTFYYRNGTQDPDTYDFYSVVEHETDEVLGTASCVDTNGPTLANGCDGPDGPGPSAVDLFRDNGGSRVFIDDTPGAYFSYDGGVTNGAGGALYNTLSNGNDYADFLTGCPTAPRIQDGTGCPGFGGLDITNDGPGGTPGPEIAILDAVGYNLNAQTAPEPASMGLLGLGLIALASYRRRA